MAQNGQSRQNKVVVAEQAQRCLELYGTGKYTLRDVAQMVGISHETVRKRIDEACAALLSPAVVTLRTVMDEQLDVLAAKAMASLDEVDEEGEPRHDVHKVIASMLKIMDRRARLHGLDAPVKVEAHHTVETEMDAEIKALFAQADQANAAELERVRAELDG